MQCHAVPCSAMQCRDTTVLHMITISQVWILCLVDIKSCNPIISEFSIRMRHCLVTGIASDAFGVWPIQQCQNRESWEFDPSALLVLRGEFPETRGSPHISSPGVLNRVGSSCARWLYSTESGPSCGPWSGQLHLAGVIGPQTLAI